MNLLLEPVVKPTFIILDIALIYRELKDRLKRLNILEPDIKELFWQVIDVLNTFDDAKTLDQISHLPDYKKLICANVILENEYNERLFIQAVRQMGMQMHQLVKNLGLYDSNDPLVSEFNYVLVEFTPNKAVIRHLKD